MAPTRDQSGNPEKKGAKPSGASSPREKTFGTEAVSKAITPVDVNSRTALGAARRPVKDQRAEIVRIVRRLEAIVINHVEGARRIRHPLTLEQVIAVIDALRAEAIGESRPMAFSDGEVTFYLMDGLYEELLGEPSNIFAAVETTDGVTRFEPLQRDFWLACLDALRLRMERLGFPTE